MNVFAVGIIFSLVAYFIIGNYVSRKVKNIEDFYVAGRNAPTLLITGSLVSAFIGTGMFLGDCGESYMGFMIPILVISVMATAGYPVGSAFFGRYVRRSEAMTIPEYFSKRFCDKRIQKLAGVIVIVICFVYMLSIMDGLSTLMATFLPVSRTACLILAWASFTFFTVAGGSKGVLITDTIMFCLFSIAVIVALPFIADAAGGWFPAIKTLATQDLGASNILAFGGNLEWMYDTPMKNFAWSVTYGIVWMLVVSVSPWQSSRYLMAKNEHTVIRSGAWACVGVLIVNVLVLFAAVMVRVSNQEIEPYTTVMIWAGQHIMPIGIGVLLVAGIVAAGVGNSFLSLCAFAVSNDIMEIKDKKKELKISRITVFVIACLILIVSIFKPPMIWWMTQISSSIVAASWGAVAFCSIWSKGISKNGAFYGMLLGFVGSIITRIYTLSTGTTLPVALDPFWIGIYLSIIGIVIGSLLSKVTTEEVAARNKLFVIPEVEKNPVEMKKTSRMGYVMVATGVGLCLFLIIFYAYPYTQAVQGLN